MPKDEIELLETLNRKRRAFKARVYESKSFADIGIELGVSPSTAHQWVTEMRHVMLPPQEEEELRQIDVAKIDASEARLVFALELLQAEGRRRVECGLDPIAVVDSIRHTEDQISKVRQERAKLLGLNKPIAVRHTHIIRNEFDEEIEELVSALSGGGHVMTLPDEMESEDTDATSSGK